MGYPTILWISNKLELFLMEGRLVVMSSYGQNWAMLNWLFKQVNYIRTNTQTPHTEYFHDLPNYTHRDFEFCYYTKKSIKLSVTWINLIRTLWGPHYADEKQNHSNRIFEWLGKNLQHSVSWELFNCRLLDYLTASWVHIFPKWNIKNACLILFYKTNTKSYLNKLISHIVQE